MSNIKDKINERGTMIGDALATNSTANAEIINVLSNELEISKKQVENVVKLIDDGNTIPFIARYRKEVTGALDDTTLRQLDKRLGALRSLEQKRAETLRLISENGGLTREVATAVSKAMTVSELEDIYRPFRPKRHTRASIARERGLLPLAEILVKQDRNLKNVADAAKPFLNHSNGIHTVSDALRGAMDIIAEEISDNAVFRKKLRMLMREYGELSVRAATDEDSVYEMYYDYVENLSTLPPHRLLAVNRGEKEGFLSVRIIVDEEIMLHYLTSKIVARKESVTSPFVRRAAEDAYKRLIAPSIANEIRNEATAEAEESSIKIFSKNLHGLLMQPPVKGKVVMGFDPGFRTGCKIAVVDENGKVLATGLCYCTLPMHDKAMARDIVSEMILRYKVDIISIGNGTASRESEIFIADLIKRLDRNVRYVITNEAGASVYSASELAADEFPDFDVSLRSAISIARRLQDPLAELVKIDPKSIGVGQYQHDMNKKRLDAALGGVVEECVNNVGVDVNTASPSLLSYVAGINRTVSKNIEIYREEYGPFTSREQLMEVPKLGAKAFEQCAGFLRIPDSDNILDNTSVHPESYEAAIKLLGKLSFTLDDVKERRLDSLRSNAESYGLEKLSGELGIGPLTLSDIIDSLMKPGRDPREDFAQPILHSDILSIDDISPGMILDGVVRNVIDFGAFVDIGVHQDGLIHISQICDRYIKHPTDVLSVGDTVRVKVLSVDTVKNRITLSMKDLTPGGGEHAQSSEEPVD